MLRCITEDQASLYAPSCEETETRKLSRKKLLLCPNCLKQVKFCRGPKKGSYFAHNNDNTCVVSNYEPETASHLKGKDILFNWLKERFKTAIVNTEQYIEETKQIADILVTHTEGEFKGNRWAFEFQHSSLSEADWEERHKLYKEANINDIWILDAEVFLKYSRSKDSYIQNARLQKEPQEAIFSTTGFCYFLNLNSLELTIDYRFKYEDIRESRASGGYYPKREIKLHNPLKHSSDLKNIEFKHNEEFNFLAMYYEEISEEFSIEFKFEIQDLQREKQKQWEEELINKTKQKLSFADKKYGDVFSGCMKGFVRVNKETIQDDIINLSEDEFLQRYGIFVRKLINYGEEILEWEESNNLTHRILFRLCNSDEERNKVRQLTFLKIDLPSLETHYIVEYADKIDTINYVLRKYENLLKKLVEFENKHLKKWLGEIHWRIPPYEEKPTEFDFAYRYHYIETKEEVDEIVKTIKYRLSIRD